MMLVLVLGLAWGAAGGGDAAGDAARCQRVDIRRARCVPGTCRAGAYVAGAAPAGGRPVVEECRAGRVLTGARARHRARP